MLLTYLPWRCSLHLRTYDSLRPSTLLTLHLSLSFWDCDVIVSSDFTFWPLSNSWLCVTLKISGNQGSERRFLSTFIIRSPEARLFWQPSGMFILFELVSRGLMTVSFLARISKFRPRFSQTCPCSSFLFKVFFRLFGYSSCFFLLFSSIFQATGINRKSRQGINLQIRLLLLFKYFKYFQFYK